MKKGAIRWRKGELIGTGAFGRVYMGMNLDSGELLAVKQVLIAANSVSKEKAQAHIRDLEEEVKLLRNLSHPNIVRYLGTAREEEALNIFLEFVPGGSIASLLGKFGSFPEPVLRMYTKQLLQGLDYLHRNGIMHRDIKGANILVDNKGCIKLADFGASKQVVQLATMTGAKSMKGTPYWMAPEVIRQTGHGLPADIWSVGCTIIEMATGKPPWSQQFQEVAALFHIGTTKSHPPIPEHLSSEAKDFLLKCLRKEPHLRPTTSELLQHPFIAESLEGRLGQRHTSPSQSQVGLSGGFPSLSSKSVRCSVGKFAFGAMSPLKEEMEPGLDMMDQDTNCSVRLDSVRFDTSTKDMFQSFNPLKSASNFNKSLNTSVNFNRVRESLVFNPMCEPHTSYNPMHEPLEMDRGWESQTDAKLGLDAMDGLRKQGGTGFSFECVLGDDDEEVTESKIKAFLDEKAVELKKLQSPLYEEFNSMWNVSGQRGVLKSPARPRRRSNSRSPTSKCSSLNSGPSMGVNSCDSLTSVGSGSPGGGNNQGVNLNSLVETDGFLQEIQQLSPGSSERRKLWKEELQRELEKKREERQMLSRLGGNSNASSPNSKSNSPNKKIGQRHVARRLLSSVSLSPSPSARSRRD